MFLAARISYIRFFTALQIYEFHTSKIIILWDSCTHTWLTWRIERNLLSRFHFTSKINSRVRPLKALKRLAILNAHKGLSLLFYLLLKVELREVEAWIFRKIVFTICLFKLLGLSKFDISLWQRAFDACRIKKKNSSIHFTKLNQVILGNKWNFSTNMKVFYFFGQISISAS